jgi:hypothetical protein
MKILGIVLVVILGLLLAFDLLMVYGQSRYLSPPQNGNAYEIYRWHLGSLNFYDALHRAIIAAIALIIGLFFFRQKAECICGVGARSWNSGVLHCVPTVFFLHGHSLDEIIRLVTKSGNFD